jgi:hypothetical protein
MANGEFKRAKEWGIVNAEWGKPSIVAEDSQLLTED